MSICVRVPRSVFQTYWHKPWAEVVAAAEAHEDGLIVEAPKKDPDTAYLHEGDGKWGKNKSGLFQQNW